MKKTPLYEAHQKAGGKIVDFHGWLLPVQYTGIIDEHENVRNAVGLFDVSHMGEFDVKGKEAKDFIQSMVTNDISNAVDGQVVYSPMCYPDGGTVDDLLVYRYNEEHFLLVVNASNIEKDFEWLKSNLKGDVKLTNLSDQYAQIAIQGPNAQTVLQKLVAFNLDEIGFFKFRKDVNIGGIEGLVSRTGYTGEDGFEIYLPSEKAEALWDKLLEAGKEEGVRPAGLGARDTLRFEATLPLYGQELSENISPLEASLKIFTKLDKSDYVGKDALVRQFEEGLKRKIVGFEMVDKGIPRSHYEVFAQGKKIGDVTSAGFCPTLKKNLGLALIDINYAAPDNEIEIAIRDKFLKAKVVKTPFYKKKYKK